MGAAPRRGDKRSSGSGEVPDSLPSSWVVPEPLFTLGDWSPAPVHSPGTAGLSLASSPEVQKSRGLWIPWASLSFINSEMGFYTQGGLN